MISSLKQLELFRLLLLSWLFLWPCSAWIEVRTARLPVDLPKIRECRRTAFPDGAVLLDSSRSFLNADQIQRTEDYVCIVAAERLPPFRVLGTADVNVKRCTVNNVFVREDARGRGIGRSLMEGVEVALPDRPARLTLEVYTQNTPAVTLYRSLGFETRGIHGIVAGLSMVTSSSLEVVMTKDLV